MRKIVILIKSLVLLISLPFALLAQQSEPVFTHEMSPWEKQHKGEIGKAFVETPPPFADIRNVTEFEPMEGALVAYPFGIPYAVIAEMSQNTLVWTIANGTTAIQTVINNYTYGTPFKIFRVYTPNGQPDGSIVYYYIHAADSSGRSTSHAIMGALEWNRSHRFLFYPTDSQWLSVFPKSNFQQIT